MVKCAYCSKPLRLIGCERVGGKSINNTTGKDWKDRKYHKKCWKHLKELQNAWLLNTDYEADYEGWRKMVDSFKNHYDLDKLL
jgi:hypothetical protein